MNPKWHKQAQDFYNHIMAEYTLSLDEQSVLQGAAAQLSLYWEAAAILEKEGLTTTTDSGMVRKHPANEICKNSWAGFLAGCRLLGVCQPEATRPGRPTGG
jgi:phage terminase small subunit